MREGGDSNEGKQFQDKQKPKIHLVCLEFEKNMQISI
jgi:hypothetical protein